MSLPPTVPTALPASPLALYWTAEAASQYVYHSDDLAAKQAFDSLLAYVSENPDGFGRGISIGLLGTLTDEWAKRIYDALTKLKLNETLLVVTHPIRRKELSYEPELLAILVFTQQVPASIKADLTVFTLGLLLRRSNKFA